MRRWRAFGILLLAAGLVSARNIAFSATVQDDLFEDASAVLQKHCLECHAGAQPAGELSLQNPDQLRARDLLLGSPGQEPRLLQVVQSHNGQRAEMPPEGETLSALEIQSLKRWINAGGDWPFARVLKRVQSGDPDWWAWQPLLDVAPGVAEGMENPVDVLIAEQLSKTGLRRNPRADRRTLIRRLSFDLHGLPPDYQKVVEFENSTSAEAWPELIDAYLADSAYGERYAQHWLDLAHYADTHGFERDQRRDSAWRYRDYVIRALNEDRSYRRFVSEQIAGDVLWPNEESSVIATGFLAAGPWDFVGQRETKNPELRRASRTLDLDDMVTQVMSATVGLTVNCARCHDHKVDPISQREYYGLQAVFAGLRREERMVSETALRSYAHRRDVLSQQLVAVTSELARQQGAGIDLADIVGGGSGFGGGGYRHGLDARTGIAHTSDFGNPGNVRVNRYSPVEFPAVDGVFIPDGEGNVAVPITSTGLTVTDLPDTSGLAWDMIRNGPVASQYSPRLDNIDFTSDGHSFLGLHANSGITFDLNALRPQFLESSDGTSAPNGFDLKLTAQVGYFGAEGSYSADLRIFLDGELATVLQGLKRESGLHAVALDLSPETRFLTFIATDGGNGYSHDQLGLGDPLIRALRPPHQSAEMTERLAELSAQKESLQAAIASLGTEPKFFGVVAAAEVPEIRMLSRGDAEQAFGAPIAPQAPALLKMLNSSLETVTSSDADRRAALAAWVTDNRNVLFSRVIVNRVWQWHFGTGLVRTPSDFGNAGSPPVQRRLLDFLAAELIRNDWSLKSLHRLILSSETWCQTSQPRESAMALDAENQLLWRQNMRRLEAESIRDSVLSVSGCLNRASGGPGFEDFTYQDAYAPIYEYVTADRPELWRRTIYRYRVRTSPNRFLSTLDCPDPANLSPTRLTTTTPLQSLTMFNNDFMLRQARHLVERIRQSVGDQPAAQYQRAFQLALTRLPTVQELSWINELPEQNRLFHICRALLNTNEFIYVD